MAKKKSGEPERSSPKNNKSSAIRRVLKKAPRAKASEVVDAVKKEYGHDVGKNRVYMIKTKGNMSTDGRATQPKVAEKNNRLKTAALWVDAIKIAKQLLKVTGGVENATALLKAVADQ